MIDASIPLQVKPPQIESPLQTIGGLMQLRGQMSEIALRQYQTEQAKQQAADLQAQANQRRQDLLDQGTVQDAMGNPDTAKAIGRGDFSSLNGRIQPKTQDVLRQSFDAHQEKLLANNSKVNTEALDDAGAIEKTLTGLKLLMQNDANEKNLPELYSQAIGNLQQQGRFRHLDSTKVPKIITDPSELDNLIATVGMYSGSLERTLGVQKERGSIAETSAKTAGEEASTALKTAQTPGAEAESGIKALQFDFMKGANADNAAQLIDREIDPQKFPDLNAQAHAAWVRNLPGGIDKANAAVNEFAQRAADIYKQEGQIPGEVAKQKALAPGEIAKAVTEEKAKAPIEQSRAIAVANANRASSGAEKLDTEYNQARTASEAMGKLLDLAEKGNKAAGQNVPLIGVETLNAINGIKRINGAEIQQYGNAGTLLDEIKGKLGKWTEGKPIPQDVLDDIRELHQQLGGQAYEKYTSGLKSLEARTPGASLPPTLPPPTPRTTPAAKPSFKVGDSVMYQGAAHKITGIDSTTGKLTLAP